MRGHDDDDDDVLMNKVMCEHIHKITSPQIALSRRDSTVHVCYDDCFWSRKNREVFDTINTSDEFHYFEIDMMCYVRVRVFLCDTSHTRAFWCDGVDDVGTRTVMCVPPQFIHHIRTSKKEGYPALLRAYYVLTPLIKLS